MIFLVGPIAVNTKPIDKMSVNVNSKTILNCSSEANPKPDYQWLQKLSSGQVRRRGSEASLVIGDTGYADQGEYTCVASNTIGGKQKKVQSEVVTRERLLTPFSMQELKQIGTPSDSIREHILPM